MDRVAIQHPTVSAYDSSVRGVVLRSGARIVESARTKVPRFEEVLPLPKRVRLKYETASEPKASLAALPYV
jgi:hypothetical protein